MIKQQKIFTPEPGFPASFWIRSKLGFGRRPQLSSISYNMAQLCMRNSVFRGGPSSASSSPLPSTPSFLERDGSLIHGFWFRTRARMMHRFSHRRASRSPIIFGPKKLITILRCLFKICKKILCVNWARLRWRAGSCTCR